MYRSIFIAISLLLLTVANSGKAQKNNARAELEALLPAFPDTIQPLARQLLSPSSEERAKAAHQLYSPIGRIPGLSDNLKVRRFLQLALVNESYLYARLQLIDCVRKLAEYSKEQDTVAARIFHNIVIGDSVPRVRMTAGEAISYLIPRDVNGVARQAFMHAMVNDSSPVVRARMLGMMDRTGWSLSERAAIILDRISVERDSVVIVSGIASYRYITRDTMLALALNKRIQRDGGLSAPRWLSAELQRSFDAGQSTVTMGISSPVANLPWFMREAPPVFHVATPKVSEADTVIRFFTFGDWGDEKSSTANEVASAIRAEHARRPFNFGLTMGDNFYEDGLNSPRSSRWEMEYEKRYGILGIPIYVTLGNHDFHDSNSAAAEISYTGYSPSKTWKLPATNYTFTVGKTDGVDGKSSGNSVAQFFVIDTESLTTWQLGWLDSALAASKAGWKIVVGHKDIYSNRRDGNRQLVPLLKKHSVFVYLNGHYHTLQHHQVDGIDYITSGAAGRELYSLFDSNASVYQDRRKFAAKSYGFSVVEITPNTFGMRFMDKDGKSIYEYRRVR